MGLIHKQQHLATAFKFAAVLGISMISAFVTADDDINASLPGMEEPPPSFDACVEHGAYDMLCLTAQERAVATTCHCVQLLHVPGEHVYQQYALMQTHACASKLSFACECAKHMLHMLSILHEPDTACMPASCERQHL